MTITEAIVEVMRTKASPMTGEEAYRAILEAKLYEFHADNPEHVVRSQIRRHCEGIDFPSAATTKHFRLFGENRYEPLPNAVRRHPKSRKAALKSAKLPPKNIPPHASSLHDLQVLHGRYVSELKDKILSDLKKCRHLRLSSLPSAFSMFMVFMTRR